MALNANTVWEYQTGGSNDNGGGFHWLNLTASATYKWTKSASGTNEYYCEAAAGGNPSLAQATSVSLDGNFNLASTGTLGSLSAGRWAWGDNDSLGYSTVYVRMSDDSDPDTHQNWVQMGYGGGTDYSQSASAVLSITDGKHAAGSTQLTSVTGGFTAAMVGNILKVKSGTNFTAGFYEITSVTDTNTLDVDRSFGASANTTGNGVISIGGCHALPLNANLGTSAKIAGNSIYIKSGTYTLGANVDSMRDGTTTAPIPFVGYTSIRGDSCTGTNRPLIDIEANTILFGQYYLMKNFRFSCTAETGTQLRSSIISNCSFSGGAIAVTSATNKNNNFINCSFDATTSGGICYFETTGTNSSFTGCYFTVSGGGTNYGINGTSGTPSHTITNCVFNGITNPFQVAASQSTRIINNTFYGASIPAGVAIDFKDGNKCIAINNIIYGFTTPIQANSTYSYNFEDYNNIYNCTNLVSVVYSGLNSISLDPQFTNAAGGDFSVGTNMKAKGFPGVVGSSTGYMDIGAVQRQEPAAGATGGSYVFGV